MSYEDDMARLTPAQRDTLDEKWREVDRANGASSGIDLPVSGRPISDVDSVTDCLRQCVKEGLQPYADRIMASPMLSAAQLAELTRQWREIGYRNARIEPTSVDLVETIVKTIPDDGLSLVVLRGDDVTLDMLHHLSRALDATGKTTVVMGLRSDADIELLDQNASIALMIALGERMPDDALAKTGLRRAPKEDIFDINRSFA